MVVSVRMVVWSSGVKEKETLAAATGGNASECIAFTYPPRSVPAVRRENP